MTCPTPIVARPRLWLTRRRGECAFPVGGCGIATRSCCNPSGRDTYCPAHRRIIRRPASMERLLAELAWLGLID